VKFHFHVFFHNQFTQEEFSTQQAEGSSCLQGGNWGSIDREKRPKLFGAGADALDSKGYTLLDFDGKFGPVHEALSIVEEDLARLLATSNDPKVVGEACRNER
jgi:hypothetical protein